MNRHGFTLVEMLATIVILSIVLGIASYGIINVIKSSQKKSEKIFVERVGGLVDDYVGLDLKLDSKENGKIEVNFYALDTEICLSNDPCKDTDNKFVFMGIMDETSKETRPLTILDLVKERLVNEKDLINPKNKKLCFDEEHNPNIDIYKDSNEVFYYYIDFSNNNCDIDKDNLIVSTFSDALKERTIDKNKTDNGTLSEENGLS